MIAGDADAHAALWFLFGDPGFPRPQRPSFDQAAATRRTVALAPISLAEVVYLVEKNRLPASAFDDLRRAPADPNHVLEEAPFTAEVVESMRQIPRADVPDMPDRVVAATGLYFGVPVISRDSRIRASNVRTVWWLAMVPESCASGSFPGAQGEQFRLHAVLAGQRGFAGPATPPNACG